MTDLTTEGVNLKKAGLKYVPKLADPEGIDTRACEICKEPVSIDERWEILRAQGPSWRHGYHTEPV